MNTDRIIPICNIITSAYQQFIVPLEQSFVPTRQLGDPPREMIYHYADAGALRGIIESKALWATNCAYMNDQLEIKYGVNAVVTELKSNKSTIINSEVATDKRLFDSLIDSLENYSGFDCFASCLSYNGDQLSQWRGYGAFGSGYSIGFDAMELLLLLFNVPEPILKPISVIYDTDNLIQGCTAVTNYVRKAMADLSDHDKITGAKYIRLLLQVHITSLAISFKHFKFHEEREFRFVVSNHPIPAMPVNQISLRTSDNLLIPYVTLSGQNNEPLPIKEIIIGPKLDEDKARHSINILLEQNGYDLSQIEVKRSEIPFI